MKILFLLLAGSAFAADPIPPTPEPVLQRMIELQNRITQVSAIGVLSGSVDWKARPTPTPSPEPSWDFNNPMMIKEDREVTVKTVWTSSDGGSILAVGCGAFTVSHWGPTPTPIPTPTPYPSNINIDKPIDRMWEFRFWDIGARLYGGPDTYVRPDKPEDVPVELWTKDGKHWKAKWVEVPAP